MIFKFAWRYFRGKRSTQAIQIISWVSVVAMAVGTAALIVVLSVFNGFEYFIKDLYSGFYPDIRITAEQGKYFAASDTLLKKIKTIPGVKFTTAALEEKVLLNFNQNQVIVNLKGIDAAYESVTHLTDYIKHGTFSLQADSGFAPLALGVGVANKLGVNEEILLPVNCYAFKKDVTFNMDPAGIYNIRLMVVQALFGFQSDIDEQYGFTPIQTLQELTENPDKYSSIEIALYPDADQKKVKKQLDDLIASYHLKSATRYEQNKTLYFILSSERWAVYAILTMMLLIASFNIIGSLSMLVIEKEKDISILKTMGMRNIHIRRIFIATGIVISLTGACIGCILALIICGLQMYFGFVKLGSNESSFLIEAYPVKLLPLDFILVFVTVIFIAIIASWIPAVRAAKREIELRVR